MQQRIERRRIGRAGTHEAVKQDGDEDEDDEENDRDYAECWLSFQHPVNLTVDISRRTDWESVGVRRRSSFPWNVRCHFHEISYMFKF